MKKVSILLACFLSFALSSYGNPVDPTTARQVAGNFWSAVAGGNNQERWTDRSNQTAFLEFYILTPADGEGFVIVAGDDCVQPILGYSTNSRFTTPLPEHVVSFLRGLELEIAYCKENHLAASESISSQWTLLIEGGYTPQATTAVSPMLITTWNQSPYYNNLCPDSAGHHAVAGCTATATAQVMKFWNWPPSGVGSHSYTDDNLGYQSADFGATTYEWSNMPNALSGGSTAAQVNAVATLTYHVAVAVEMNFGISSSGAYVHSFGYPNLPSSENALVNNFRYKNTLHSLFKEYTSDADWINTLTSEIDAGRPVLETGFGDGGGHAFVCDGYDNNGLFHINWGWGGYMDGYFAHNALNPGTGGIGGNNGYTFNQDKGILVGIEPDGMLDVSPAQLNFPQEGGNCSFTVSPNIGNSSFWYATANQPWITLSPNNGGATSGTATVTATATANTSGSTRTATITITQGPNIATVQVTQTANACAITNLPWSESFEEGLGCWTTLDADGDGNNWFVATGVAHDGTSSMVSYSYNSNLGGSLHANNYLVSPSIALPAFGSHEFIFHARSGNSNYPDTMMVKLTTGAGTSAAQFSATLLPLTVVPNTAYQQYSLNLSAYNGQTVRVAIVHKAYDGQYLAIDDISIVNTSVTKTVTAISANSAMGVVTGGGTYHAGDVVTLTAIADNGYRFIGWSDSSTVNPREITVTGDVTLVASFADLGGSEHHYDNGTIANRIGAGGTLYWGIRFPAGELADYSTLSGARLWNYDTGQYELRIYQGGSDAPGTLIASQTYSLAGGDSAWFDALLTTPVTLNQSQPLWVIFYNTGTSHPATGSHYAGNPDGSWVSVNGSSWNSVCDYGFNLSWMVRALLSGHTASQQYTLSVNSADFAKGVISGGGSFSAGDSTIISATAFSGYRFTGWSDGNTKNPRTVTVMSDTTITALFADLGDTTRHYDNGIRANNLGAGGSIYWGIRFPAGALSGYDLMGGIKVMDNNAGIYELSIYQGGDEAPGNLISSQSLTFSNTNDWHSFPLATPISLNHALPTWIVLHNTGVNYPAAGSHYAGNPDGSWMSLDGENWGSVCDYGYYYTWMIRADLQNTVPVTFHTITAVSDNGNTGSVSGSGTYPTGETVTLKATPALHYHFLHWDDGSTDDPRTVTVTGDALYTAFFEIDVHQITVVSEQPNMGTTIGSGSYPYGSTIQIEAIPYTGYEFQRWLGGNTDNPRTVTVTGNKTYSALFQPITGIEEITKPMVEVHSEGNTIVVDGAENQSVEIYDITGKLVVRENGNGQKHRVFTVNANGNYLVRTGNGFSCKVQVIR